MIDVLCSSCGYRFRVEDREAGRLAQCPNCRTHISVPNAPSPMANGGRPGGGSASGAPGVTGVPGVPGVPGGMPGGVPGGMPGGSGGSGGGGYGGTGAGGPIHPGPGGYLDYQQGPPRGSTSAMAVTCLVLGILGICLPLVGLVALVLGIFAYFKVSDPTNQVQGKGLAIAGMILGAVGTLLSCLTLPAAIGVFIAATGRGGGMFNTVLQQANLTTIHQGLQRYAAANQGQYPHHVATLIHDGYVKNEQFQSFDDLIHQVPLSMPDLEDLKAPETAPSEDADAVAAAAGNEPYPFGDFIFTYRGLGGSSTPKDAVVAFSAQTQGEDAGRYVLLGNGQVERHAGQAFRDLIQRQNQRRTEEWKVPPIDLDELLLERSFDELDAEEEQAATQPAVP